MLFLNLVFTLLTTNAADPILLRPLPTVEKSLSRPDKLRPFVTGAMDMVIGL
jgi:hypothetical protein